MIKVNTKAALLGVFSLGALFASAQAQFEFIDVKTFKQVGPDDLQYEGGSWTLELEDGDIFLLPCLDSPSLEFTGPNIFCPAGTNGFISRGDLDGDGEIDDATYESMSQPQPARVVEPFRPDLIQLNAAPPSDLERPIAGFDWEDKSVIVQWNLVTQRLGFTSFELTRYDTARPYLFNELRRHRREIVPGAYDFQFPALGFTAERPNFVQIRVGHREMVEGFPGPGGTSIDSNGISVGNDFILQNDEVWRNGQMEIDPRLFFTFRWEGINPSTFLPGDQLFFSIFSENPNIVDDEGEPIENLIFPPFIDGSGGPINPLLIGGDQLGIIQQYELGPGFFELGDEVTARLQLRRSFGNGIAIDRSRRFFEWDIFFIDSFDGFVRNEFPNGTSESMRQPTADFDDDGFTNLEEFALSTDPIDPASVPVLIPEINELTRFCSLTIPKRPAAGTDLIYEIQYSTDRVNFITIDETDPNFFIPVNDDEVIIARSQAPVEEFPCFLRAKITLADR